MSNTHQQDRFGAEIICLEDQVSADSFARVVDAFVDSLDLHSFGFRQVEAKATGRPPYLASDLLKLYIYGHRHGIRSSRKLAWACTVNIELWWLLCRQRPSYKTIAEFRRINRAAFRKVFRHFTLVLKDWALIEGLSIAVDSVKMRAQNLRKNNYNQAKLGRQMDYIDNKIEATLEAWDAAQSDEARQSAESLIELQQERRMAYEQLERKLKQSGDTQISTTDVDARMLPLRRKITEVAYATQAAVDARNNLIANYEVSNQRDTHALSSIAIDTKELLEAKEEYKEISDVLADKGYHTGSELKACDEAGILTYVAPRRTVPKSKSNRYTKKDFEYNEIKDYYTCPAGHQLYSNGNWYTKNNGSGKASYQIRRYVMKHSSCAACRFRRKCVGEGTLRQRQGRAIEQSEYDKYIRDNADRVKGNKNYYRRRQTIVEHPFGTIKRQWGMDYQPIKRAGESRMRVGDYLPGI